MACSVIIEGEVLGNLSATHEVIVAKRGRVRGDIKARSVSILGQVNGYIEAEILSVHDFAFFYGEYSAKSVEIAKNAIFEGVFVD